ncbi:MAG: hypothetical protein ACLU0O_07320 [Collinsella sp.]
MQSFNRMVDVVRLGRLAQPCSRRYHRAHQGGRPYRRHAQFYYKTPRAVDRTQYALASGFAEILSTQLAIHELEVQRN